MIRFSLLLACIIFVFSSCTFWQKKDADLAKTIKGDWLILYPDHDLRNAEQRKIYSGAQDSIVNLLGLKTISFQDGGAFLQTDSIFSANGIWHFNTANNNLFIRNAGKGLDFFQGNLAGIENDTMRIVEIISISGKQIKLTWYLKRIADKKRAALFGKDENEWRKKIGNATNEQLKNKVRAMLVYYSLYYEMVSKESTYFSQSKVFLPFRYYQHSMGLKPFNETSDFSQLFYNTQQAEEGYGILSAAFDKLKNQPFPSGKDFVIEYSKFMKQMAEVIK